MNKNNLASHNTRRKILAIARKKFETQGFANTSLQEIVREIGLSRGAFYHHYKKKEDLLIDLIKEIQDEIAQYVKEKAMEKEDIWEQLVMGSVAFVEKATDKDIIKILLIDGPSVISWKEWKEIDNQNSEHHLKNQLTILQSEGFVKNMNINYLTSFISGGLNELAINISLLNNNDINEIENTVRIILEGIRDNG